jgi:hypothetical protein
MKFTATILAIRKFRRKILNGSLGGFLVWIEILVQTASRLISRVNRAEWGSETNTARRSSGLPHSQSYGG